MNSGSRGRPRTIDTDVVALQALDLFEAHSFDDVTMDDVAVASGVSRRSLFRLFPTKGSILLHGFDEFTDRLREALNSSMPFQPIALVLEEAFGTAAEMTPTTLDTLRRMHQVIASQGISSGGVGRRRLLTVQVAEFLSARRGTMPRSDFQNAVLSHVTAAAAVTAIDWWALNAVDQLVPVMKDAIRLTVGELANQH